MSSDTLPGRLVDTVACAALGTHDLCESVFTTVPLTVTRCCYQELLRGRDDADERTYREGCAETLNYLGPSGEPNTELYPTGQKCETRHGRLKDNIGERTIAKALEQESDFVVVVTFDDDVSGSGESGYGDEFQAAFAGEIPEFSVFPPNEPLYRLYDRGELTEREFCTATEAMIREMGWRDAEFVDKFWTPYADISR